MTTTRFAPGFSDDGSKVKMPLIQDKIFPSFVESLPSLKGKCIAITGTTSGTGYWCALAATKKEASVVLLLNRKSQRATVADADVFNSAANSTKVVSVECDLSSFKSCMRAARCPLARTPWGPICARPLPATLSKERASAKLRTLIRINPTLSDNPCRIKFGQQSAGPILARAVRRICYGP